MILSLLDTYGSDLLRATLIHTMYVFVSVGIGFIIGLTAGILLSKFSRFSFIILPIVSVFQTIPGLVFVGILFLIMGMRPLSVIIALSVYAIFPIMKNTYAGITEVSKEYVEAAKGCGMNAFQRMFKVILPLAMPAIIAGLRMSAVYTVSWAVLAAMIGLGGLGDFIYQGTSSNNNTLILLGAIPAAILAIVIGFLIDLLQKKLTYGKPNRGGEEA